MNKFLIIVCFAISGCQGRMQIISTDQKEKFDVTYSDGMGTRTMNAISSLGEIFSGQLIWIKDPGTSGRYRGALLGSEGRTLQVELECNSFTTKCVGIARDNEGQSFFIN